MYIKTPKRYRRTPRRSIFSLRRFLLFIFTAIAIFVGIGIYENREMFPQVGEAVQQLWDSARQSIATAAAPTPTPTPDPTLRISRANELWAQGLMEDALEIYEEILPSVPNDVVTYYRVTLGRLVNGDIEGALEMAEKTVTANPFSSDAWAIRALALEYNGRYGEGIASALHALELKEDNARALAFLAELYLDLNQTQRALDTVNRALEMNPNSFEAYRIRGRIYQDGFFDLEAALADYEKAAELAPHVIYPSIDYALMKARLGNVEDAIDILDGILVTNPRNVQALFALGRIYYQDLGTYTRAADYFTRCVEADPDNIFCLYLLGRSQYNLEQFTAAAESFRRVIELGSQNGYHYYWAGNAQVTLGNCQVALTYLTPGYDIARQSGDTSLISAFEDRLAACQSPLGFPTSTPTPTPDPLSG